MALCLTVAVRKIGSLAETGKDCSVIFFQSNSRAVLNSLGCFAFQAICSELNIYLMSGEGGANHSMGFAQKAKPV